MATATLGKESQSTEGEKEMTENEKFIRKIMHANIVFLSGGAFNNSGLSLKMYCSLSLLLIYQYLFLSNFLLKYLLTYLFDHFIEVAGLCNSIYKSKKA